MHLPHIPTTKSLDILTYAGFLLVLAVLIRVSWVGDDAYIAFKASYNLIHGYGPNYNRAERVQVYTSPLNFYLQTGLFAITKEYLIASQLLGIALTMLAVILLHRLVAGRTKGLLAIICLLGSRAFIDYSKAGLENSLAYVLVLYFIYIVDKNRPEYLWRILFMAGLIYLCRQDFALLVGPIVLVELRRHWLNLTKSQWFAAVAIGASLPVLWTCFSIIYYGYPFPNTYYSKTTIGTPLGPQIAQGILYIFDLILYDPPSFIVLGLACFSLWHERSTNSKGLLAGILLYILYIVSVGGDFMTGRFFSVLFLVAVYALFRFEQHWRKLAIITASLLALSITFPYAPLSASQEMLASEELINKRIVRHSGIADERMAYYRSNALIYRMGRYIQDPAVYLLNWKPTLDTSKLKIRAEETAGIGPFYAGPTVHILDLAGLGDPLLSHLPSSSTEWRVGHIYRNIPAGYQASLVHNTNEIVDKDLYKVYNDVRLVTRGSLFSRERWRAIWRMNSGYYSSLLKDKRNYQTENYIQYDYILQKNIGIR